MSLSILLGEDELRSMPADLREKLLAWYFARPTVASGGLRTEPADSRGGPFPVIDADDSKRVSFPELVRARLLSPGDEILCRTLKRQQRKGEGKFFAGATVTADGTVEYKSERFSIPSKLAFRMVNENGGHTKALNGYDYIFVKTGNGVTPLNELRDRFLRVAS